MQNPNNNYRHIIEQIEDYAILLLDENGIILDWNRGTEKIKGYKAKEIIGKNFRVFYPEQDRESKLPEQLIARAIKRGSATHEGFRVRKDGSLFWGSILITALFDKTDKLTGFLKITRDLTEKKELEEKLRKLNHGLEQQVKERTAELQKQFREISDYKFAIDESSIVAITDLKGIIIHANDNFCKISKYTHAELIGQDHIIVNSGYHPKEFMRELWVTIANGKIWKGEIKNKAKDGTIYWVDTTIVPFLSEAGKPTRYIAIRTDITRQKESEEKLIASENQFRNVLENMMEGVQIIDFNWRYVYANDALARYSYHTKEQLVGYTIMEKYPGVEQTEMFKTLKQCMEERTAHQLETEFVFPDGSKKDFELRVQPVPEGIFILSVDITERKKAAQIVSDNEKKFRSVLDNMQEAVMLVGFDYQYLYVNEAMAIAGKMPKEDFLGHKIMEKYPGIEQTEPFKLIKKCLEERITARQETEFVYPDGSVGWGEIGVAPVEQGALYTNVVITERKLAEKAQAELHTRFKAIFEKTNDAIMLADDSRKYVQVNPATVKLLGYSEQELIGKSADDIVSHRKIDELSNEFMEDGSQKGIIELIRKDGSLVICHYDATSNILPGLHLSILTDITEQKKAERDLIESEKKYRLLFENNPLPMWMLKIPSYKIVDVNDAAIIHYGYPRAEFLTMTVSDLRPKEDIVLFEKQAVEVEQKGTHRLDKLRHKKKNGELIIVDAVIQDIKFEGEKMRVVLLNDVTEQERAIEELKQSEARLAQAQAVTKVGSWQTDLKTLNIVWSRETYRIFEIATEKFQPNHTTFLDFVHPDDRLKVDDAFKNSAQHNGFSQLEHRIITAAGTVKFIEERWEILRAETGEPMTAIGTCQDITERISAVEKIKQSEEDYRFLFNNSPAVIFIWDLETLKIIEANKVAEAKYGYTREEFLNITILDLRLPEEQEKVKDFALQMLHNPLPYVRRKLQQIKKDGETMMMDITWHPVTYKDRPSIFSLAEDITERILIEEELKRTYEDVRQLNAHLQTVREEERKRIGREIHDELGQQLTAIKMDTVWIDKQIPSETVPIKNKLQNIIELLDGSNESVRKILNELRPTMLDENGLLDALQWQGQQFTESTGSPVHFTSNQNSIKLPQETSTSIFRVYQEALTNIMRYADADKVLSSLNVVNDHIILTIEDDGKGFDLSMVQSKKTFGILGMKERVLSLNGKFDLISSPGKGTKIVITLPYDDTLLPRQEETERH